MRRSFASQLKFDFRSGRVKPSRNVTLAIPVEPFEM
jgi:hypothetical protein